MNGIKEEDLPEVFDSNSYQVLLVANKYQTGFDQPKLCAMYVDKRLRGVNAVQTLSRLNRICAPYDKKTFVLDFKNEYEDIQASFAPFYTETILNETITPSDIRTVEAQVDQYDFLDMTILRNLTDTCIRINEPLKKRLGCGLCWINPCKSSIATRNWKSWKFVQLSSVLAVLQFPDSGNLL